MYFAEYQTTIKVFTTKENYGMKKNKKFTISTTTTIRSSKSGKLEKDMKRIAKGIFSYNPKTDPNDPLFDKTTSKKGGNEKEF